MLPELAIVFDQVEQVTGEVQKTIRALDPRALDYVAGPQFNSPAAIATHIASSTRWWIGEILAGRNRQHHREAEFLAAGRCEAEMPAEGRDAADLVQALDETLAFVKEILQTVTPEMLDQPRQANEFTVTVRYILPHVLAHTAEHLGHLQITRQMWERLVDGL